MKKITILLAFVLLCATPSHAQKWLEKIGKALDSVDKALESVVGEEQQGQQQSTSTSAQKKGTTVDVFDAAKWSEYPEGTRFSAAIFRDKKPISPSWNANTPAVTVSKDPWAVKFSSVYNDEFWMEIDNEQWVGINALTGERINDFVSPVPMGPGGVALYTAYKSKPGFEEMYYGNGAAVYLIDRTGKRTLLPGVCAAVPHFNEDGVALVSIRQNRDVNKHGWGARAWIFRQAFVNTEGKIVWTSSGYTGTISMLKETPRFSDGLRLEDFNVINRTDADVWDSKWGYIDKAGKTVIPGQFKEAREFSDSLALTQKDGKWGFIDTTGKVVIPYQFSNKPSDFINGYAMVRKMEGAAPYAIIDKTGQIVKENIKSGWDRYDDGVWYFYGRDTHRDARELLSPDLKLITNFEDGCVAVKYGGKLYVDYHLNHSVPDDKEKYQLDEYLVIGQKVPFDENGMARFEIRMTDSDKHYSGLVRPNGEVVVLFQRSVF